MYKYILLPIVSLPTTTILPEATKIIYIAVWRRATDRKQRRLDADRHILCKGVPYSTEMNLLTDSPEHDATILVVSHSRT